MLQALETFKNNALKEKVIDMNELKEIPEFLKASKETHVFRKNLSHSKLVIFCLSCWAINLSLFWPGILSPDSVGQFEQAKSAVFTNHHPALMTFIWSLLHKLVPGPGLFLACHQALWWGALFTIALTLLQKGSKRYYFVFLLALWPTFLGYNALIWKDVSFSLSYFFVISLVLRGFFLKRSLKNSIFLSCLLLLFYGTGVKYQAVYVLPVVVYFLLQVTSFKVFQKKIVLLLTSLVISMLFYHGNKVVDSILVPPSLQSNSWQMARLYDLAGISYFTNKALLPDYIKKSPTYSFKKLHMLYNSKNVDPYLYDASPALKTTQDDAELKELWSYWKQTVYDYKFEYFLHRSYLWLNLISQKPQDISHYLKVSTDNLVFKDSALPSLQLYFDLFPLWLLNFFWVFPILVLTRLVIGSLTSDDPLKSAISLLKGVILSQLLIYFFLSMASDLRYVFLSNLCGALLGITLIFKDTLTVKPC
ncbi:MAG TPA: hypothetical protein VI959_00430 [Alphaproteobacteria bacterium]|nr:hypothetical protein [Alphaproteobacteria bacterium]